MSIARRARHESKVCKTLICFFFRGYPNRAHEPYGEGLSLAVHSVLKQDFQDFQDLQDFRAGFAGFSGFPGLGF